MSTNDLSLVTRTLGNLLDANVRRLLGLPPTELIITTMPPELVQATTQTLNLHMYAIREDAHFKNAVGMPNLTPPIAGQPMALRLYYILTPHLTASNEFDAESQQRILGLALKTFHDNPVITDALTIDPGDGGGPQQIMDTGLQGGNNEIEIALRPLEPEETVSFWAAEDQRTARLAAFYEVRTVLLNPEEANRFGGPVLSTGIYVQGVAGARITGSRSELVFAVPAAIGLPPQRIPVTPARTTLQAVAVPDRPRVRVIGRNLTAGDDRIVTLRAPSWAAADTLDAALNPDWDLQVQDDEISFVPQATVDVDTGPGGIVPRAIVPGGHEIGLQAISYRYQGTARLEARSDAGRATVWLGAHIDQIVPDAGDRFRIDIDPVVDLTLADVTLVVGGELYAATPVSPLPPAPADRGVYEVFAASILFGPLFDTGLPGTYPVRLVVNGVESQPFWVEV